MCLVALKSVGLCEHIMIVSLAGTRGAQGGPPLLIRPQRGVVAYSGRIAGDI